VANQFQGRNYMIVTSQLNARQTDRRTDRQTSFMSLLHTYIKTKQLLASMLCDLDLMYVV